MSKLNLILGDLKTSQFGEQYFVEANQLTFEKQPSQQLFQKHFGTTFSQEDMLFIIVGTDSGLLYNYLKGQERPNKSHFVFIDFQNLSEKAGLVASGEEIWEGSYRLVNQDFNFFRLEEEFYGYLVRRKVVYIKSIAVSDAAQESPYFDLWKRLEIDFMAFARSVSNASRAKGFEFQRLINSVDNFIPSAVLADTLVGRDALIMGGGPSLNSSIEWIKKNQSKFIIFSVGRISKRLLKEGLNPDFVVTVDPQDVSFQNAKELLDFSDNSILINAFHAVNSLVGQWSGLSVYTGDKYSWKTDKTLRNFDVAGPTVTNSALHQAFSYGAKRIFFIGLDFCFHNGQTHEAGSHESQAGNILRHKNLKKVMTNSGELAETSDDYYMAMQTMEENIATYKRQRKIEFVSLGKASAQIKQVVYQDFDEVVLDDFDKTPLINKVKEVLQQLEDQRLDFAEQNLVELKKQLRRFERLVELSKIGITDAPKVYDSKTKQMKAKPAERVQKNRRRINNLIAEDGDMLLNFDAQNFMDSFKTVEDEENMSNEEVTEQLLAFFKGVNKSSQAFIEIIQQGIERTELRIKEVQGKILPSELFSEWEKINQFGRVNVWQKWHAAKLDSLDQLELDCIAEAVQKSEDYIKEVDSARLHFIKSRTAEVSVLLPRAEFAFEAGNLAELNLVIEHSEKLAADDQNQKESFINYLKAMQAELEENFELAEELYRSVSFPLLQQKALKRLLNFKMTQQDFDASLALLESLCQFSLDYMLPYADLLSTLGNKEMALEVIKMYLAQNPENFDVHVKMAQLQFDLGMQAEALDRVSAVLEIQPDHPAAKVLAVNFGQP